MNPTLCTIGHSTHSIDEFLQLLKLHNIELLADIRRFPGSRRLPHFNQQSLDDSLSKAGIQYRWFEQLGGRRGKTTSESINLGLRNESFRSYADYMQTEPFQAAIRELLEAATQKRTAYMCSEGVFWRCHRRLVSDYLLMQKVPVQHIMPGGKLQPHSLTEGARIETGKLTYPSPQTDQTRTLFS